MRFGLLGCRLPGRNDSNGFALMFFTEDNEQNPLFSRVTDTDETLFVGTVVWIVELCRMRICPDGLCFLEPDAVLLKVRGVLDLVPFKFHLPKSMLLYVQ